MKAVYERPRVAVEFFTPSSTVADCTSSKNILFDCFKGNQSDNKKVLSTVFVTGGCTLNVGVASVYGVSDFEGDFVLDADGDQNKAYLNYINPDHTEDNKNLDWGTNSVTAKSDGFLGWLFMNADMGFTKSNINNWSKDSNGNLKYSGGGPNGDESHGCIAPIYGVVSVS